MNPAFLDRFGEVVCYIFMPPVPKRSFLAHSCVISMFAKVFATHFSSLRCDVLTETTHSRFFDTQAPPQNFIDFLVVELRLSLASRCNE